LDCGPAALAARDCGGVELTHAPATMHTVTASAMPPARRDDAAAPTGESLEHRTTALLAVLGGGPHGGRF
jgi:hypothetical protein